MELIFSDHFAPQSEHWGCHPVQCPCAGQGREGMCKLPVTIEFQCGVKPMGVIEYVLRAVQNVGIDVEKRKPLYE